MASKAAYLRTILIVLLVLGYLFLGFSAQAQTIKNGSQARIGELTEDGTVKILGGKVIGKIEDDGTLTNAEGKKIGSISTDGYIYSSTGVPLGHVDHNMILRDGNAEKMLGRMDFHGNIFNQQGKKLGKAEGVKPQWALASFFFFYFRDN